MTMRSLASGVVIAVVTLSGVACQTPPAAVTLEKDGTFGSHRYTVRRDSETAMVTFTPDLPKNDESFIAASAVAIHAAFSETLHENALEGTTPGEFTVRATNGWRFRLRPVTLASGEISGARIERLR